MPDEQGQKHISDATEAAACDRKCPVCRQGFLRRWSGEKLSPGESGGDHHARYRKAVKSCVATCDRKKARPRPDCLDSEGARKRLPAVHGQRRFGEQAPG